MDLESVSRWEDYSRAKDEMFVHTDIPPSPWYVVESDIKKHARLNMSRHLLSTIPYTEVRTTQGRAAGTAERQPRLRATATRAVDRRRDYVATLMGDRE